MAFVPSTSPMGFFPPKQSAHTPVDNCVEDVCNPLVLHSFAHCPHSYPQKNFCNFSETIEKEQLT